MTSAFSAASLSPNTAPDGAGASVVSFSPHPGQRGAFRRNGTTARPWSLWRRFPFLRLGMNALSGTATTAIPPAADCPFMNLPPTGGPGQKHDPDCLSRMD